MVLSGEVGPGTRIQLDVDDGKLVLARLRRRGGTN